MKAFGIWIRGELDRQKCSSKDVVGRILDGLIPASDSIATVTTKFSKLLNGDPEGDRYFMDPDRPDRIRALANAIGRTLDEVTAARARFSSRRTLILDPRLCAEVVASLVELSRGPDAGFSCVAVPCDAIDVRRALRDAADGAENAIVVVANEADTEVFGIAKVESSVVERVPRGLRLKSYPDVIRVPPPQAPRTFDEDGRVLVPISGPFEWQLHYQYSSDDFYRRLIQPAVERDETPCLSLHDAITWFTRPGGPLHSQYAFERRRVRWMEAPSLTARDLLGDDACDTQIWEDSGRVFAFGPRVAEVAALLLSHHEVRAAPFVQLWNDGTRNANPWRLREAAQSSGHALHSFRDAIQEWAPKAARAIIEELMGDRCPAGRLAFGPDPAGARQLLRAISRREFDRAVASSAFVLSRAVEAPWVVFEADDGNIDLVADMGAGSLLSIRGRRVEGAPNVVRSVRDDAYSARRPGYEVLECGDYVLALRADSDVRLEGPLLPGRARRRAQEQEQQEDDSYDDD